MNLDTDPWSDLKDNASPDMAMIGRIGVLPHGMTSGNAAVCVAIQTADGKTIIAQTSWKLLNAAVKAFRVRYGDPEIDAFRTR
jgi:hypothetical protein